MSKRHFGSVRRLPSNQCQACYWFEGLVTSLSRRSGPKATRSRIDQSGATFQAAVKVSTAWRNVCR
jgi:hypothetical protein